MWGVNTQSYYQSGRSIREVQLSSIDGVCECGYLTLTPTTDFERQNGGLTIKRSKVRIVRDDGSEVKRLRMSRWYGCNACVNNWK